MVSHMTNDCEPTTGAWSYHVGHWYALTVPSSGSRHRSNVQQVEEDMRQSVEQTLIESKRTEGGNNQQHHSD